MLFCHLIYDGPKKCEGPLYAYKVTWTYVRVPATGFACGKCAGRLAAYYKPADRVESIGFGAVLS